MAGLPDKKIRKIKLPGDVSGNKTYEIVPEMLGKSGYAAELPTLTKNSTIALNRDITLNASSATQLDDGLSWTLTDAQYNDCVNENLPANVRVIVESGTDYYLHRYFVSDGTAFFSEIDASNDELAAGILIKGIVVNQSGTKTFSLIQGAFIGTVNGAVVGLTPYTPNSDGVIEFPDFEDQANKVTSITSSSTDVQYPSAKAVWTLVNNLPEPMVFKGTLGTGGTITSLPAAAAANEGFTYKVITAATYASIAAKVGDVFVSNGSAWVLIPAGDDIEDTWRNVKVDGTEKLGTGISTGALDFISQNTNYGDVSFTYSNGIKATAKMPTIPTSFNITVTDDILDGTGGANSVKYAPYSSKGAGHLYTGTTNPSSTNRLNYDGYLYATKLYSGGSEVLTGHQSIKSLNTTATSAQSTNASEAIAGSGTITLHKIAKTGTYSDLIGAPTVTDLR